VKRIIKKYGPVLALFLLVLIAVIFRASSGTGFMYDASLHAGESADGSNIINTEDLGRFEQNALFIDLGPEFRPVEKQYPLYIRMDPESVLLRKNFRKIRKHDGPVILISSRPPVAARMWMIISQKGVRDIYILSEEEYPEGMGPVFQAETD
jgi:hypothetical protein